MNDFDLEKKVLTINKSYQRLEGEDVITSPKTAKSNRVISMPDFLVDEIRDYMNMLYKSKPKDRIFQVTKHFLHHEMKRGSKLAGVKRITIHDLRHSHISLLIDAGFTAVDIANRVGHESIRITYHYSHMFPSKQIAMAERLNLERIESDGKNDESEKAR
jgi:integrase